MYADARTRPRLALEANVGDYFVDADFLRR
jgi:hypothetical protein